MRPELSPSSLADMHWTARRLAVLISVPRPQPPVLVKPPLPNEDHGGDCHSGRRSMSFTLASSASSTLPTSNIVTNSLTDDLNILTDNKTNLEPSGHLLEVQQQQQLIPRVTSTAHRERHTHRESRLVGEKEQYHDDDIDWLLADRKCAGIQAFYASTYATEPKLWRRILMYL